MGTFALKNVSIPLCVKKFYTLKNNIVSKNNSKFYEQLGCFSDCFGIN